VDGGTDLEQLIKPLMVSVYLLVMICSSASADPRWATPPAKYDHPFAGKIVVHLNWTPIALGAFWPVYGYTFVIGTTCHIQVWRAAFHNSLYRHERAHCNGWPSWHPRS
jgi:hypothetical protein